MPNLGKPTATASHPTNSRLASLDALRGVAIILVILGHYAPDRVVGPPLVTFIRPFAVGGVILFFLLSGFLIAETLSRKPRMAEYALHRITRIIPAYWIAIAMLVVLQNVVLAEGHFSAGTIAANMFLIADVTGSPLVNGVFWTLLIEAKFYILAPLIVAGGRTAILAAPFAAMAVNCAILLLRGGSSNFLTYLSVCLAGMSFALWYRGKLSSPLLGALTFCLAGATYLASPYYKLGLAIFVALNAAALALALTRDSKIAVVPFVGVISYSLYLYHTGIGYPLMRALEMPTLRLDPVASTAMAVVVCGCVAWLSYQVVERPGVRFGRTLPKKLG